MVNSKPMQSVIILGTPEKTKEKVQEILNEAKISKFDVHTYFSEKTIGILDIRNLQKNIFLKPGFSEKKAIILEGFTGITIDAQNSFLKTLEEPPQSTIILILVSSLDFLLPTVFSRCSLINLTEKNKHLQKQENYLKILISVIDGEENPLVIAQTYGKDKETALKFLENLIIAAEENINTKNFAKVLRKLQKTHTIISSTNTNIRFTLENLFLNL